MLNVKVLLTKLLKQLTVKSYSHTEFTYASGWSAYATSGSNRPMAHKCGRVVNLSGNVTPSASQSSAGSVVVGKVPSGCEPITTQRFVQHGSGQNKLCLVIVTDGTISIERYGTTSNIVIPATSWINIGCTYISAS